LDEFQAAEENAVEGGAKHVINKLRIATGPDVSRPQAP